jgi:hypothetical protein
MFLFLKVEGFFKNKIMVLSKKYNLEQKNMHMWCYVIWLGC